MFKKFTAVAFTGVVALGFQGQQPVQAVAQESQPAAAIHLLNGQIFLNGKLVHKGFSITQSRFAYLYFYVPDRGLFTISNQPFDGGTQAGAFSNRELSFNLSGLDVVLKSSSRILSDESAAAWVKFDPDFKLDVKAVMLG